VLIEFRSHLIRLAVEGAGFFFDEHLVRGGELGRERRQGCGRHLDGRSSVAIFSRVEEKKTEEKECRWTEFQSNDVYRRFELPEAIDVEKATAPRSGDAPHHRGQSAEGSTQADRNPGGSFAAIGHTNAGRRKQLNRPTSLYRALIGAME
jgi:hypothetical protein